MVVVNYVLGSVNKFKEFSHHKTDAEWEIEMNGKVMTIYNYKDGKNYNGRNGLPVSKITEWHIGSADDVTEEVKILAKALEGEHKMM